MRTHGLRFLAFLACAGMGAATATGAALLDLAGQRVLFLGDSITHAGGYIRFIEYELLRRFPDRKFDLLGLGLSSETVSGLSEKEHPFPRPCVHERLGRALAAVKPQVVVACYGMNDGIYHPQSPERLQAYQDGMRRLIADARAAGAAVILLTPPPFDPLPVAKKLRPDGPGADFGYTHPYEHYDRVLADYAKWLPALAAPDVRVIDLNGPMSAYIAQQRAANPSFHFSGDGIHPDETGHLLMARLFLRGIGLPVEDGDLAARLAAIHADPVYPLVVKRGQTRSNGWRDFVGYTREKKVKTESVDAAEQQAAELEKQIAAALRTPLPAP